MSKVIFRLKLKELFRKKGVTQTEMAERTGILQPRISSLVNMKSSCVNIRYIELIASELNVTDPSELFELIRINDTNNENNK